MWVKPRVEGILKEILESIPDENSEEILIGIIEGISEETPEEAPGNLSTKPEVTMGGTRK